MTTMESALVDLPVEVEVAFPDVTMTPAEILRLQRGDVITICPSDASLRLHVGGVDIGTVRPARNGDRTACVLLTTVTDPGLDEPSTARQGAGRVADPTRGAS
jgi:flagellar motor switch protein FliM